MPKCGELLSSPRRNAIKGQTIPASGMRPSSSACARSARYRGDAALAESRNSSGPESRGVAGIPEGDSSEPAGRAEARGGAVSSVRSARLRREIAGRRSNSAQQWARRLSRRRTAGTTRSPSIATSISPTRRRRSICCGSTGDQLDGCGPANMRSMHRRPRPDQLQRGAGGARRAALPQGRSSATDPGIYRRQGALKRKPTPRPPTSPRRPRAPRARTAFIRIGDRYYAHGRLAEGGRALPSGDEPSRRRR